MKSIDYINKVVSKNLDIDETIVKKVNSFYWKSLIKEMHAYNNPAVFMRGLGNFYMPLRNVRKRIQKLIKSIKFRKANISGYIGSDEHSKQMLQLKNLWEIKNQLQERNERDRKKKIERQNQERSEVSN